MSVMKRVRRDTQHEGCDSSSSQHRRKRSAPPVAGYCRVINKALIATDWDAQEQGDIVVTQLCQIKIKQQNQQLSCFPSGTVPQDFVLGVSVFLLEVTRIKRDFAKLVIFTVCKELGRKEGRKKRG